KTPAPGRGSEPNLRASEPVVTEISSEEAIRQSSVRERPPVPPPSLEAEPAPDSVPPRPSGATEPGAKKDRPPSPAGPAKPPPLHHVGRSDRVHARRGHGLLGDARRARVVAGEGRAQRARRADRGRSGRADADEPGTAPRSRHRPRARPRLRSGAETERAER